MLRSLIAGIRTLLHPAGRNAEIEEELQSFYDATQRMAVALDLQLDDMEFFIDFAKTSERVDLGWFVMEKGTNGAVRAGWNGKVKGDTLSFEGIRKIANADVKFNYTATLTGETLEFKIIRADGTGMPLASFTKRLTAAF